MTKQISFPLFLILIFSACGPKAPTEPEISHEEDMAKAGDAFADLTEELGETKVEKDLAGVRTEVSGAITEMETVAEPDAAEMIDYETGKPGWIEVTATRVFPESVSNPAARDKLLNILRNEAVSKKVPRTVEVASLLTDVMSETAGRAHEQTAWSGFFKSTVSGVITQEDIVEESNPVYLEGKSSYEKSLTLESVCGAGERQSRSRFTVRPS